ncbi:MAG: pyrroline-5-carboxylate reductase [Clostridia bacterium]|nr:pyrroline-5-carboxylate reductase [Clostridia bacterium]
MDKKIGFIGAGNMGGAIVGAIARAGYADSVYVFEPNTEKAEAIARDTGVHVTDRESVATECDIIFLAVKPQIIGAVASELSPYIAKRDKKPTLVSMLAGVPCERISELFATPVIRIMPNTPVNVGEGMILVSPDKNVDEDTKIAFNTIMEKAGRLDYIDEGLIDAACALSGCGPAFVYTFIKALANGAEKCGLSYEKALMYACQTTLGAARLALSSDKTPDALRDAVCSKGGSTIEGVKVLDGSEFDKIIENTLSASYKRTVKLGKQN